MLQNTVSTSGIQVSPCQCQLKTTLWKGHEYFLWNTMQCYWCKSNIKRFWNCKYKNSIATYLLNTCFPSVLFFKISHTFLAGTWAFPHIFSTNWPLTINSWTYQNKKTLFWTVSNIYNSIPKTIQTAMQSGFNIYNHETTNSNYAYSHV